MARIDSLYLEYPCSDSRSMVDYLAREEIPSSHHWVRNLMRRIGLRPIYQKPHTTVPGDPSAGFPCRVDLREITAVDKVLTSEITYIPLQQGFLYLVVIMGLLSRHLISWKLSNSLDTEFCWEALELALTTGGKPVIFYSDQGGGKFTSTDFIARLQDQQL
jgi:putative transposase